MYQNKYLKYKTKYLNLQKQLYGGNINKDSLKAEVLAAVKIDGLALKDASTELKADKEVVKAAVSQNGLAL